MQKKQKEEDDKKMVEEKKKWGKNRCRRCNTQRSITQQTWRACCALDSRTYKYVRRAKRVEISFHPVLNSSKPDTEHKCN